VRDYRTWVDDVRDALRALGGEAHLSAIYAKVLGARMQRGEAVFAEYQGWVRNQLRQNSHRKGLDIFEHVGPAKSGGWKLK
jgi:hypothetical protein